VRDLNYKCRVYSHILSSIILISIVCGIFFLQYYISRKHHTCSADFQLHNLEENLILIIGVDDFIESYLVLKNVKTSVFFDISRDFKGSAPVRIDPTRASDVTLVTFLPLSTRNGLVKDWHIPPCVHRTNLLWKINCRMKKLALTVSLRFSSKTN